MTTAVLFLWCIADYFSTMANNIGGTDKLKERENFSAHVCVQNIKETLSGPNRPPFTFSSVQPDGLHPKLLKMILKEIVPSWCTIFNTSIEMAAWPETCCGISTKMTWNTTLQIEISQCMLMTISHIYRALHFKMYKTNFSRRRDYCMVRSKSTAMQF